MSDREEDRAHGAMLRSETPLWQSVEPETLVSSRPLFFASFLAFLAGCSSGGGGSSVSPTGLDVRPSNATCLAPARPVSNSSVQLTQVFTGLPPFTEPVLLLQRPGDATRWYLVQQDGRLLTFPNNESATSTTSFLDLSASVAIGASGEGGLLGFAFDPLFTGNGSVYASYTLPGTDPTTNPLKSRVSRFHSADAGLTAVGPPVELVRLDQPYPNHNGGDIVFGPDGFLYAGFGDGGSAGDPLGNGQNKNVLFGKILRLDVSSQGATYTVPADNPFAGGGGAPEIYAYGLRNPWRFTFDRGTGDLWAGDVGQDDWEEVDRIELGGNYGWNDREGTHCYPAGTICGPGATIDPVVDYDHGHGQSITGGYVYRGDAIPGLVGTYVYADYVFGTIWALTYDVNGNPAPQILVNSGMNISSFGEGENRELYVLDYSGGRIFELTAAAPPGPDNFPKMLSATGCVDPQDAKKPAAGLIPYDVNAALWSDGAEKSRWLAIPDGATIHVGVDGDWDLPNGSVLMKEFRLGAKRIETRLLMRHADGGWAGYSYRWNDAQTDATLLPGGASAIVGAQTWSFPSRVECLACHTDAAGRSLGLETAQLNGLQKYPQTGRTANQLSTLSAVGILDTSLTPAFSATLPDPFDTAAPLHDRARAYLHANCAMCHRPDGPGQGSADYRYRVSDSAMGICNVVPGEGDLGVANAKVLAPGDAAHSILSLRMHALDSHRMPPLGSRLVDASGTGVVDAWIESLAACP